jgi:hypothetical protein
MVRLVGVVDRRGIQDLSDDVVARSRYRGGRVHLCEGCRSSTQKQRYFGPMGVSISQAGCVCVSDGQQGGPRIRSFAWMP